MYQSMEPTMKNNMTNAELKRMTAFYTLRAGCWQLVAQAMSLAADYTVSLDGETARLLDFCNFLKQAEDLLDTDGERNG
jgi:hypothetical protein